MNFHQLSDDQIMRQLGQRVQRQRLSRNWTQAELADRAGIGKRTLSKLEAGKTTTLGTWIAVLRGLRMLDQLDALVPMPLPSPVELAKQQGRRRKKASGVRSGAPDDPTPDSPDVAVWPGEGEGSAAETDDAEASMESPKHQSDNNDDTWQWAD